MNDAFLRVAAAAVLSGAFGAGAALWQMRRWVRDLNGLGKKYHRMVALMVRWADTDEKRAQVANLLDGK